MASSVSTYYFLVLFCFLHQTVQSTPNFKMNNVSNIGSLCSRKCDTSGEQTFDEDAPLYQCSCSPSCSIYGDCCFDSPYKVTTVQPKKHFVCLSVVGYDRYRAVSDCPSNVAADVCKDGLGHLPPVTSRVTNVTYTNIFCAKCNDDKEDLIKWNVELRCSSGFLDSLSFNSSKFIYRSGKIWRLNEADRSEVLCKYYIHHNDSSFMKGLELRSCTTYARKRSRCSPTWKDPAVLELCRSYEDPVYFHNTVYRNVHCALCNYLNPEFADCIPDHVKNVLTKRVVDSKVKFFSKTRGSNVSIHSLSDYFRGEPFAFSILLDINEKGCVPPRGRRCCRGQAFDIRTKKCRKILDINEKDCVPPRGRRCCRGQAFDSITKKCRKIVH